MKQTAEIFQAVMQHASPFPQRTKSITFIRKPTPWFRDCLSFQRKERLHTASRRRHTRMLDHRFLE